MNTTKQTALYERLSRDDGDNQESNSIATQKRILEQYAEQHGLFPYRHWTDDGFSGKDFSRPAFQEMYAEIEKGKVGTVIVKNLDRFGRAYLESGLYRENFRKMGIRFIAIGDGIDTAFGDDDFTPFREVINEFYLREYSKKIKAAFHSRGMSGKHTSSYCPYGYYKSPEDKNQWLVDETAAAVVRRVFNLTMEGKGPYQICCILKEDKVEMPGYYLAQKGVGLHKSHVFPDPYNWTSTTVINMLSKKEYLGHTVNFKSKKDSYKDKKNKYVPEDEWVIFENTHEPIIDQETFDNVQRIRKSNVKRRPDGWGYVHPLSGLVYCADCGGRLYVHRIYNGKDKPTLVCGNYAKGSAVISHGVVCESGHRIDAATVMELVHDTLRGIVSYAQNDKAAFEKAVKESLSEQRTSDVKKQSARLAVCEKRAAELEILIRKVYEDNALGKMPDKRFNALSAQYESEQTTLEKEIAELQTAVSAYESGGERASKFIALVKRYQKFEDLSVSMLNEFIEKIIVFERDRKGCRDSGQQVDIYLNFIGKFTAPKEETDPAALAAQEEEQRVKRERQEKLRNAYLERKANGKQKEYERKYKERRKALRAADKAATYAEGAVIGADAAAPFRPAV